MLNAIRKNILRWFLFLGFIILILIIPRKYLEWRYGSKIHLPSSAPSRDVAIVFGAGLRRDGLPSNVLADRVRVASDLYKDGVVSKLLISGSMRLPDYDEPTAMRDLALQLGVSENDIILDRSGARTYDTCFRAKNIFHIDEALLVSQDFHLPRALGICDALGLEADGITANLSHYNPRALRFWQFREILASLVALWDAYIVNPSADSPPGPVG